jgi:hypothetical protein
MQLARFREPHRKRRGQNQQQLALVTPQRHVLRGEHARQIPTPALRVRWPKREQVKIKRQQRPEKETELIKLADPQQRAVGSMQDQ